MANGKTNYAPLAILLLLAYYFWSKMKATKATAAGYYPVNANSSSNNNFFGAISAVDQFAGIIQGLFKGSGSSSNPQGSNYYGSDPIGPGPSGSDVADNSSNYDYDDLG